MGDSLVLWYDMDVFFPFFLGVGERRECNYQAGVTAWRSGERLLIKWATLNNFRRSTRAAARN